MTKTTNEYLQNSAMGRNPLYVSQGSGINGTYETVPDQALSAAALSYETTETKGFNVIYVYIDFQVAITETCSIWKTTSGDDELLETVDLIGNRYVRFIPDTPEYINVDNGEQFKITCTNANVTGTAKTTLKIENIE